MFGQVPNSCNYAHLLSPDSADIADTQEDYCLSCPYWAAPATGKVGLSHLETPWPCSKWGEMAHYYYTVNDIQDTSCGGTYHNKRFKEESEKRGLLIDYDAKIGYSITQPAPALKTFCTAQHWRNKLTISRTGTVGDDRDPKPKKPSSTRKYVCPCCGQSIRATKEVNIMCMDCNQQMKEPS